MNASLLYRVIVVVACVFLLLLVVVLFWFGYRWYVWNTPTENSLVSQEVIVSPEELPRYVLDQNLPENLVDTPEEREEVERVLDVLHADVEALEEARTAQEIPVAQGTPQAPVGDLSPSVETQKKLDLLDQLSRQE